MNKTILRQYLREKRLLLSQHEQETAALAVKKLFCDQPEFTHSQYIAGYWPILGEMSPLLIIEEALRQKKKCFLPVMPPQNLKKAYSEENNLNNLLSFVEYRAEDALILNPYGIMEPPYHKDKVIPVKDLDIVLTPLLGFDLEGTRLGMGKGFYDKTFAFLNENKNIQKPRLIGLAYDWQAVPQLPREQYDVSLFGVVTDMRFIRF